MSAMKTDLLLSVVIPVYNGVHTLEQCLQSVQKNSFKNFELIIVDDGSSDGSRQIAAKYTNNIFLHEKNQGLVCARMTGIATARGEIVVNIDADVVIFQDTLGRIADFFEKNSDISAVTGRLSKKHPHSSFFSQYKNLYMNYIFGKLPNHVNFLYGSIHALKKDAVEIYQSDQNIGEDSERGQRLISMGKKIAFLKDLEVVHLKKYSFMSWVKNDFRVPYHWATIFIRFKGWKSLGKNKTGYLHSPKEQLASVVIGPLSALLFALSMLGLIPIGAPIALLAVWGLLNASFIAFLWKEKGAWFGLRAVLATYFDHLVMATGIFFGLLNACYKKGDAA